MKEPQHYSEIDFQNYLLNSRTFDKTEFESHINDCPACHESLSAYRKVWSFVQHELKTEKLHSDLATIVLQKVSVQKQRNFVAEKIMYGVFICVGLYCLMSCITYLLSHSLPFSFVLIVIPLVLFYLLTLKELMIIKQKFAWIDEL